ncbi:MAG: hypothetical protein A2W00_00225 [Candidatus Eisenbacteria bacterium RBG_16_71_46]|nr:MAG: hypothetical protein A2W00_00225 [Candidatus Eisenbacteria bacterium RBG_16_71_46]
MIPRVLRAFVWLMSALAVVAYVFLAGRRLLQPALDPGEGAILEVATRLAQGGSAYLDPTVATATPVMPGFPFVVSLLARRFGPHLWEPRLIAVLALLGVAALALAAVRRETDNWTPAVASAGFVLMGCGLIVESPGIARPEALMLLLALLALFTLRVRQGPWGLLLSGALFAAAFLTHPLALWFAAAAMFSLALEDRGRLLAFAAGIAVLCGGGYVAASQLLGPWFNYFAWDQPLGALRFVPMGPLHYMGDQLLGRLGVLTLAAVMSFALPVQPWRGRGGLWMCMGIAALAAGMLATQSARFGGPALIPSVVALALIGPISIQRVTRHLSAWPGSSRLGGQGVVLAALTLQFIMFLSCVEPALLDAGVRAPAHAAGVADPPAAVAPAGN